MRKEFNTGNAGKGIDKGGKEMNGKERERGRNNNKARTNNMPLPYWVL